MKSAARVARRQRRFHFSDAANGFLLTALCWAALGVLALVFPPRTPIGVPLLDLLLLAWIAEFLYLKSWLMIRRTELWDRLGLSIIAVNLSFAVLYQLTIAFAFWPRLNLLPLVHTGIRVELALVVTWGVIELLIDL